jgi:hypothetical protein
MMCVYLLKHQVLVKVLFTYRLVKDAYFVPLEVSLARFRALSMALIPSSVRVERLFGMLVMPGFPRKSASFLLIFLVVAGVDEGVHVDDHVGLDHCAFGLLLGPGALQRQVQLQSLV